MGYLERIDGYKEEMIKTLQELIAIPSVRAEGEPGMPFGKAVDDALVFMLRLGEATGFAPCNIDHYGGHLEFEGRITDEMGEPTDEKPKTMGILIHLDVVPEGSDWEYPPYGGELAYVPGTAGGQDSLRLYGRGAMDDKGPAIAAFYAMKALKEEGFVPQKNIRMILGLDEETSWDGMERYLAKVEAPDFSFTPDADFPVIHGEMGILIFELAAKFHTTRGNERGGLKLRSVSGGTAANSVADSARAVVRAESYDEVKEKLRAFRERTGYQINCKGRGKSLEIVTEGVSAHGATPWKGKNAITVLMEFLDELPFAEEDKRDFIRFYRDKIGGEFHGQSLGCGFSDEVSGPLILNVGMIHMDEEMGKVTINIRYPISFTEEQIYEGMMPAVNEYGLGIVKLNHKAPIFVPREDPLVQTLLAVYRKHTGDTETEPMVIGGGTYARAVPGAVAFGANYPGEPEVQHQKNEYITVERLMKTAKIYADAIYELTKEKD